MGDHRRGVTGAFQITNQLDGCWLIPSVSPWLVESLYLFFTSPSPFISLHILIVVWMLIKKKILDVMLIWLVVSTHPSEKYEFVSWDDDIPN